MTDIIRLSNDNLKDLQWDNGTEVDSLSPVDRNTILALGHWYHAQPTPESIAEADALWMSLTEEKFLVFDAQATVPVAAGLPTQSTTVTSSALEFQKGTKRSAAAYPVYKNPSQWKAYHETLVSQGETDQCSPIFDSKFKPSTPEQKDLFRLQQQFMYGVFVKTLIEARAADILAPYKNKKSASYGDAQAVYRDLVEAMTTGTTAELYYQKVDKELDEMELSNNHARSLANWLVRWHTKMTELCECKEGSELDDDEKVRKLKKAIQNHEKLTSFVNSLRSQAVAVAIRDHTPIQEQSDYNVFYLLLHSEAQRLDKIRAHDMEIRRRAHQAQQQRQRQQQGGPANPGPLDLSYRSPQAWARLPIAQRRAIEQGRRDRQGGGAGRGNQTQTQTSRTVPATGIQVNEAQTVVSEPTIPTQIQVTSPAPAPAPANRQQDPGAAMRQLMSNSSARAGSTNTHGNPRVNVDGQWYVRETNTHEIRYRVTTVDLDYACDSALVDGGSNGGLSGNDVVVVDEATFPTASVTGIDAHTISDLKICQVMSRVMTTNGPVIGIFNQYAHHGKGHTIHSKAQLKHFGCVVDDRSRRCGGEQRIIHPDGYVIPLSIRNGLPYMSMKKPTEDEIDTLPHVMFTSDLPWDPSILDNEFEECEYDACVPPEDSYFLDPRVDAFGMLPDHESYVDYCLREVHLHRLANPARKVSVESPDLNRMRPNFGWLPVDRIRKTIEATTQFYRATISYPFRKHYRTRFPAANVDRRPEWMATDTFFSDVPAHDDGILGHGGATMLQLYVGLDSKYLAGYPMVEESQMAGTAEDLIRDVGAPLGLFSDNAKTQTGKAIQKLLRMYAIKDAQSEPHYQHQNPAERAIQDVKRITNTIMDRTATPAKFWLLCTLFVIALLNHMVNPTTGKVPLTACFHIPTDISGFLDYVWWQKVYYEVHEHAFPSETKEALAYWTGPAEKKGDFLTYQLVDCETEQVIYRSNIRPANDPMTVNKRASPPSGGEKSTPSNDFVYSFSDTIGVDPDDVKLPFFSPDELLGLTFLLPDEEDNDQVFRATVTRQVHDRDAENHEKIKFLVDVGDGVREEIISYNELSDLIERQHEAEAAGELNTWAFKEILGHQGPLSTSDKRYKGSRYNVLVAWEDGSQTYEPLGLVSKDDPVTCAKYALENDLLEVEGWKSLKRIARRQKVYKRMVNQAKLRNQRHAIRYKFGVRVPRNHREAVILDEKNNNTLWKESEEREMEQILHYKTFRDLGKGAQAPDGYKKIPVRFVYDVKQSGLRKARLICGGHLTDPPVDHVYSGVVSLRSMRIVCMLAELNDLELMACDIGNAYLTAFTSERVYTVAGPELGELEGHTLIIEKALYGLRTSAASFAHSLADTLRSEGFVPSFADENVWMRDAGDVYEYICVWVDDLLCAMKNPMEFMDKLRSDPYNYKLKGVEEPRYHLGGDFWRDPDGTLAFGAKTYIKRMVDNYEMLFGEKPKPASAPLEKGDHPELDSTAFCSPEDTAKYQSLVGALQWTISLCRFDIAVAVMTLGRYRVAPLQGHLERVKRVCGYLRKYPDAAIRFRTGIPDHSEAVKKIVDYDWMYSVYGDVQEELPRNMPPPKGKKVRTTTYKDANLYHDYTTGRAVTGVLHFVNQTPIDWTSKRQATVETATYGSEFTSARTATEQIIDMRFTLRMLGVPLDGPAWLFGDNQSVVTSSTLPHSSLNKRHNALSYHRVREAVASKTMYFLHMDGKQNPSDTLSKFLPHCIFWPLLEPLLFSRGETKRRAELESSNGISS